MSTFVEFSPETSSNKITRFVRLDNDFKLTVGVDTSGTVSYSYFNLTNIPSEHNHIPSPPDDILEFAQLVKDGTDESLTIRIKMFYNGSDDTLEPYQIPRAWTYGNPITATNYEPGVLLDNLTQNFSGGNGIVIWNTLGKDVTPPTVASNTATAPSFLRKYAYLGSLAERRDYLKGLILQQIEHPNMNQWLAEGLFGALDSGTSELDNRRHIQTLSYYPEMLTRAISIDSNLDNEQKFNLLEGMAKLSLGDIISQNNTTNNATIDLVKKISSSNGSGQTAAITTDRDSWTFIFIGDVHASSPHEYMRSSWDLSTTSSVVTITMVGSTTTITTTWQDWLRS